MIELNQVLTVPCTCTWWIKKFAHKILVYTVYQYIIYFWCINAMFSLLSFRTYILCFDIMISILCKRIQDLHLIFCQLKVENIKILRKVFFVFWLCSKWCAALDYPSKGYLSIWFPVLFSDSRTLLLNSLVKSSTERSPWVFYTLNTSSCR